jgi:hypothetical protein
VKFAAFVQCITVILVSAAIAGSQAETVRFIAVGDSRGASSGINETILTEIVQATIDEAVDFIIIPGDLVNGSVVPATLEAELLQWRTIVQPLYDSGIGVYPVRGNHDAYWKSAWDNVFTGQYALPNNGPSGEENITFSFSYGNVFVVGLDHYVSLNRVNQTWLDQQFAANDLPHVFAFGHSPAFKMDHSDCLDDNVAARDSFWNSMAAEGARVYFCGHDHFYDHCRLDDGDGNIHNDLHQYIVGTAGAPLRVDDVYNGLNGIWTPTRVLHEMSYGYALVEVAGAQVTITWKHRTAANVYEATSDIWTYSVYDPACCEGITGNLDADPGELVDIADLTHLIAYLYIPESSYPICLAEANIDGSVDNQVDIGDLTALIAYLYIPPNPTPAICP